MLVVATMLDLITPELVKGLRAFVARYTVYKSLTEVFGQLTFVTPQLPDL